MKDIEIADSITSTIREIIELLKVESDRLGYSWCYSHTDAVYVIAPKELKDELLNRFNLIISNHCKERKYCSTPVLEFKGYYPTAYIHSPARNVLVCEDGQWEATGMNYIRSEVPEPLREIEKSLISMKLENKNIENLYLN